MKNLFKSKIRWQHRSSEPTAPAAQAQGPGQGQGQQPPSPSPASSPSGAGAGAGAALSRSTPSSSSPSAAATPTGAPAGGAGAGGGGGGGGRGEDYMLSEEEFQMQLAMALSASNSESVGDLDGEQIRKAKLMSLDRFAPHRDEGHTAESLSRRYWDTTSESLKKAIVEVLSDHGLVVANIRGQGYDGASNMRGEFNGLQKLIRDENPCAFYIHCFAHQLQLIVVAVSKCCSSIEDFFDYVSLIVNSTCASCKRKDLLLDRHRLNLLSKLESGEISSGRGKQQETSLTRPGDTRWGSHYKTLLCIESMWDSVIEVLEIVNQDERNPSRAGGLVQIMESFSFVFIMKMMLQILRITNELSLILQRKDQNVVQAMSLIVDVRARLNNLRSEGWEPLFEETRAFCLTNHIPIPNMSDEVPRFGRSRKGGRNNITQDHYFRVDIFYAVIDAITTEFDHRFNETSSELLVCFSCLDPRDSFSKFDVDKLARIADIYYDDFSFDYRKTIKDQLQTFIIHVRRLEEFKICYDLASLSKTMVRLERHIVFPLVYRLIELALLLPVATATVERAFSAMKIIKTELRNKMTEGWLNDLMVCYIEREIFKGLDLQEIKKAFQKKKGRQMQLPRSPRRN